MKKLIVLAAAAMLTTGCAQQTFVMAEQASQNNNANVDKPHHFFISGLGQSQQVDAAAVCNGVDKVSKVEVQQTFLNGLLSTLTFGIYTPRQARVYCKP